MQGYNIRFQRKVKVNMRILLLIIELHFLYEKETGKGHFMKNITGLVTLSFAPMLSVIS